MSHFSLASLLAVTLVIPALAEEANVGGPSDPEIAHIVVTANTIDIDMGKFAKKQTKNKEVRDFAQVMIKDHTSVNKQATELAKKLNVTPKSNATSDSLKKGAKETTAQLKGLKGAEFDKGYVDREVTYHQAVLDTIDQTLIPNADNVELKKLITDVRPAIEAHLGHAKSLQAKLSGGQGGHDAHHGTTPQ
jgi:putative membrane protein